MDIDCIYCVDANHRSALENERIFIWIVVAWACVIVHILSSLVVCQMIDNMYMLQMDRAINAINVWTKNGIDGYYRKQKIKESVTKKTNLQQNKDAADP